ncbi:MAG: hypothetical protein QOI76_4365, partial [Frankiales bacterium]|nr:hypothetical protein [Frankiales bacterium]
MYAGDLDPTKFYALRHPAGLDPPGMIKVRVTSAPRKQKIKICYVEGDLEGLEEWVTTRSLICEWGGRTRIHRDEQRERELAAASALVWDRALEEAINTVFDATGEDICWYKGSCRVSIAVAERLW